MIKKESTTCENCNCGGCCGGKCLGLILTAIGCIVAIVACIFAYKASKTAQDIYNFNVLSAGGEDNFDRMSKVYQSDAYVQYATDNTEQAESYFGLSDDSTYDIDDSDSGDSSYGFEVEAGGEEIKTVVEDMLTSTPIRGDDNARFTIVEYTELLCPYCKMHSQAGTINSTIEEFPGEVNSVSRSYIIHKESEAPKLAEAMECVIELKPEIYHEVFDKAFEVESLNMDTLISIVAGLGVDESSLRTCVDEGRYTQSVNDGMIQASSLFGINGTPGNVIIDRETGNYVVVSGAFPLDAFIEAINELKNA